MRDLMTVVAAGTAALLATGMAAAGDGVTLRYQGLSGPVKLTVEHRIILKLDDPVEASRTLSFELAPAAGSADGTIPVTIESGTAGSAAHGMTQRLGTRHLLGRSLSLSLTGERRRLEASGGDGSPGLDLGPMVPGGLPLESLVADALPVLPEGPVAAGDTWKITRPVRTLEGWAWAEGELAARHRVESVRRAGGRTVISVVTEGKARIESPEGGGRGYAGNMTRTLRWTFEAASGRILSLVLEQETEGLSELGQGQTPIHQTSRIELAPSVSGAGS